MTVAICQAINAQFTSRIWPIPTDLQPLPARVQRGTRCLLVEELGYDSGADVGDVCIWDDRPNADLPTMKIGVGSYCVDKACMMLAPSIEAVA